ncbi:YceD family protein [Gudongella oleilytica]|uniref:YceD family protein n=1 Tax=Gudongella oleilytica TaxID=1582259 RepID=UPI000FF88026|nr:DUF177 domain-containing protein [Gudongella oleilytica]
MLVDLSGFLHGDEAAHSISLELDENAMPNKYEYPVKYPIILKVDIYKVDGEYLINVEGNYGYEAECDRCLKLVNKTIEFKASGGLTEKKGNIDEGEYSDEVLSLKDDQLDLGEYIWDQIVSSLPMKFICSEGCKGLCPKCGKNLNEGDCGCGGNTGDLRFEKLRELSLND